MTTRPSAFGCARSLPSSSAPGKSHICAHNGTCYHQLVQPLHHTALSQTIASSLSTVRALRSKASGRVAAALNAIVETTESAMRDDQEDAIELTEDLLRQLDAVLREAERQRSEVAEFTHKIDVARRDCVRDTLADVKGAVRALLQDRAREALVLFDELHAITTNVDDLWRALAMRGAAKLNLVEKSESLPLEARIIFAVYPRADLEQVLQDITVRAFERFKKKWARVMSGDTGMSPADTSDGLPVPDFDSFTPDRDPSAHRAEGLAMGLGLSAAALAAGWHTVAWTAVSLALPAGLLILVAHGTYKLLTHNEEKTKRRERFALHLRLQQEEFDQQLDGRFGVELRLIADFYADAWERAIISRTYGIHGGDAHNNLISAIARTVRDLSSAYATTRAPFEPVRVMRDAITRLRDGDLLGGAPLAALGFELAVVEWARRMPDGSALPIEGRLSAAIELLHRHQACNTEQRAALHKLRRLRNEITHRLPELLCRTDAPHRLQTLVDDANAICPTLHAA